MPAATPSDSVPIDAMPPAADVDYSRLVEELADLRKLLDFTHKMAVMRRVDAMTSEALAAMVAMQGGSHGLLYVVEAGGERLRLAAALGFDGGVLAPVASIRKGDGVCGSAVAERRRVVVAEIENSALLENSGSREFARACGVHAIHCTPLITHGGRIIGAAAVLFSKPGHPADRVIRLSDLYAQQSADLLDAAQIREDLDRELTEKRNAEAALGDLQERLRLATTTGKVGLWDWNIESGEVTWTDSLYFIHGMEPGEPVDIDAYARLIHPEDKPAVEDAIRQALQGSRNYEMEFRILRPDGAVSWVFTNATVARRDGKPVRMIGATLDITERRLADEASRQLAAIVESSEDAIVGKNLNSIVTSWNRGAERLFGYTAGEMIGKPLTVLSPPERLDEEESILSRIRLGERIEHYETVRRRRDGSVVDVSISVSPIRDAAGRVVGASNITRDITERKRTTQAIHESERTARRRAEMLETLNAVGSKLVAEHDLRAIVQMVTDAGRTASHAAFGAFFYNATGPAEDSCMLHTLSGDAAETFADVAITRATTLFAPAFRGENVVRIADMHADAGCAQNPPHDGLPAGHPSVRSCLAVPVVSRTGEVLGGLFFGHPEPGVFTEEAESITASLASQAAIAIDNSKLYAALQNELEEQRRTESMLRESEQRWRQLAEAMPHLVWTARPDGLCDFVSPQWTAYTGEPESELLAEGWLEFIHADDAGATRTHWRKSVACGGVFDTEFRIRRADGEHRWFKARAVPIRNENGEIVRWYGSNTDVEESRRAEKALRASEHQLRVVTDHAPVYLAQTDRGHRLKFVNRTFAERHGLVREAIIGRHLAEIIGAEAYESVRRHLDSALEGNRVEFEQQVAYSTVGRRWVHIIYEPERAPDGGVTGIVSVVVDVTARKAAEQEVERARDEAVAASRAKDDFLAALSHELRTPLSPILLLASDAANNPKIPREIRDSFEMIRTNVSLEARLIEDLLDLTRITRGKMTLERQVVDVHGVLRDAIANIRRDIDDKRLELNLNLSAARTAVVGDPVRLQQIFWNVLKNAVKFTHPGGSISVVTSNDTASGHVRVVIADTGIGMSQAEIETAFEAFTQGEHASSAAPHRFGGLGLGLAISRKLVELHSGRIHASSPGRDRGATFVVELPAAPPQGDAAGAGPRPASDSPAPEMPDAPQRSILLVEDHASTRETLRRLLSRRHYSVSPAASATEAIALASSRTFDFVVSDVGLPDGDGYQLLRELRRLQPGLSGIAISGYGMEEDLKRSRDAGFTAHLVKPVSIAALAAALASLPCPRT